MSTNEDENEMDDQRILEIKKLLFKTFKVCNKQGMRLKDF
jgi:hypothetical protein